MATRRLRRPAARAAHDLDAIMQEAVDAGLALVEAKKVHEAAMERLHKAMRDANVTIHQLAGWTATRGCSAGRQTNTIDPKKFHKLVSDAEFYSSVSVSVTMAKKLLSEKQLAPITTTTDGKPGEETVKITATKL